MHFNEHNFQIFKRTCRSDNLQNFRFGGMQLDLLDVVFNTRSPISSLCCQAHSSLPIALTSRRDLKSLFRTIM